MAINFYPKCSLLDALKSIENTENIDAEPDQNTPTYFSIKEVQNTDTKRNYQNPYKNILSDFIENKPITDLMSREKFKQLRENTQEYLNDYKNNYGPKAPSRYRGKNRTVDSIRIQPRRTRKSRYNANYYQHFYNNINKEETIESKRKFSAEIADLGDPLEIFNLAEMGELSYDTSKEGFCRDIAWTGSIPMYNRLMDKLTPKSSLQLKTVQKPVKSTHSNEAILDDEIIEKAVADKTANIFITDLILSTLMATSKPKVAWDIQVRKIGQTLYFFQKRKSVSLENEFLEEIPLDGYLAAGENELSESKLSFANAAVTHKNCIYPLKLDQPIHHSNVKATPFRGNAYRYRKFDLGENFQVLVRCEIDAFRKENDGKHSLIQLRTFGEFEPASSANSWRCKLEVHKGSVLVDEVRKNSFNVTRWVAQCDIAGADELKIGFISRKRNIAPYGKIAQMTLKETPRNLFRLLGSSRPRFWGLFRHIAAALSRQKEDGDYLLVKDPNTNDLLLFSLNLLQ